MALLLFMRDYKDEEIEYLDFRLPSWSKRRNPKHPRNTRTFEQLTRQVKSNQQTTLVDHQQTMLTEHDSKPNSKNTTQQKAPGQSFNCQLGKTIEQLVLMIEEEEKLQQKAKKQNKNVGQSEEQPQLPPISSDNNHLSPIPPETTPNSNFTSPQPQPPANNPQKHQHKQTIPHSQAQQVKQKTQLQKELSSIAKTKISWPTIEVNYFQNRISLSVRTIHQYSSDVLLIPFITHNLQYYPGSTLKQMLETETSKLGKSEMYQGSIYLKNTHKITNFKYLVFLKVAKPTFAKGFATGLSCLFKKITKDKLPIKQMLFCWDETQLNIVEVMNGIFSCKQFKKQAQMELCISVSQKSDFKKVCTQFQERVLDVSDIQKI